MSMTPSARKASGAHPLYPVGPEFRARPSDGVCAFSALRFREGDLARRLVTGYNPMTDLYVDSCYVHARFVVFACQQGWRFPDATTSMDSLANEGCRVTLLLRRAETDTWTWDGDRGVWWKGNSRRSRQQMNAAFQRAVAFRVDPPPIL